MRHEWFRVEKTIKCLNGTDSNNVSKFHEKGDTPYISIQIFKAMLLYRKAENDNVSVGVGLTTNETLVSEVKMPSGDTMVMAIQQSGRVSAAQINAVTDSTFKVRIDKEDNASYLFLTIMPEILKEEEAKNCYRVLSSSLDKYDEGSETFFDDSNVDQALFARTFAKFSDNVYQRIMNPGTPYDIHLVINTSGECTAIKRDKMDARVYMPKKFIGTFTFLSNGKKTNKKKEEHSVSDMPAKYSLHRKFNANDRARIPDFSSAQWEANPVAERICNLVNKSRGLEPIRNFMLYGPAGTAKTVTSGMVAYGLQIPKVTYTCHEGTEIFDFIGQISPNNGKRRSFDEIIKELSLPTLDDIQFDLEGSYQKLTGKKSLPSLFDAQDCTKLLIETVMGILTDEARKEKDFSYHETDFLRAIRNGWLVEIQEPSVIDRPGVLVGLNSLLETNGAISLPTGEIIVRHPDTTIILTTNRDYKGCNVLNKSVKSRMDKIIRMDNPTKKEMKERAMKRSGFTDNAIAETMTDIVININEWCQNNRVREGGVGPRELIAWMKAVAIEGKDSIYANAIDTVIEQASEDQDEQEEIRLSFLDTSEFANF